MASDTKIEWCDDTVNPWWGCAKVSPACANCYAEGLDHRFGGAHWGAAAPRKFRVEKALGELERLSRRAAKEGRVRRVFIASMADLFEDRPDVAEARHRFLTAVRSHEGMRDNLRLLLLTKRPEVMERYASVHGWESWWWAGTTVEDQRRADDRIPHLLRVPAAVRFLSCEPLLSAIELPAGFEGEYDHRPSYDYWRAIFGGDGSPVEVQPGIHWIIVGGESGPKARPMHPAWVRSLRDQAVAAGVAFHLKQHGEWVGEGDEPFLDRPTLRHDFTDPPASAYRVGKATAGRLLDGREWNEVPDA